MTPAARPLLAAAVSPSLRSVTGDVLGFPPAAPLTRAALDRVPQAVISGFRWALEARTLSELERHLWLIKAELRGFGYEGATMALTLTDAVGHRKRTCDLLSGPGRPHLFLAYIGIGFAMSRLPRRSWKHVIPDLDAAPHHPAMSWLAVDGYGFDLAYFSYRRWGRPETAQPRPWPWLGEPAYFTRATDQGLGRALWFIHGGDAVRVASAVGRFTKARQPDLWSGVGLAATYAGPHLNSADLLRELCPVEHRAQLACGAILAAAARIREGVVPAHSERAIESVTSLDSARAAGLAEESAPRASAAGPIYEQWRANIRCGWQATLAGSDNPC